MSHSIPNSVSFFIPSYLKLDDVNTCMSTNSVSTHSFPLYTNGPAPVRNGGITNTWFRSGTIYVDSSTVPIFLK